MSDPEGLAAHAGFLRGLARGLLFDRAAADDVAQKALLLALQRAPRSGGGSAGAAGGFSLRAWLAGVVRNLARERAREEERRTRREQAAATPEALPSAAESAARLELLQRIVTAVRTLEEPYRTTVLLRFFDGLKPAAIAKRMDVPVETVRTRIKRALERLRLELDAGQGGDRAAWGTLLLPCALPPAGGILGVVGASVAIHALAVGGLGALAMSTKVKAAIGAAAAVIATAWIVQVTQSDPPRAGDPARAAVAPRAAKPALEPAPESSVPPPAAAEADAAPVVRTPERVTPALDPTLTFLIRGTTRLADRTPRGGFAVKLSRFDGYETTGKPGATLELESDSGGAIVWAMRPPAGTITILAESSPRGYLPVRETLLVLSGDPPGTLDLTFHPFDCEIFGKVMDERDEPIAGARVQGWSTDGSAATDEAGEYRLRACSSHRQAFLSASAPGRAETRATAQQLEPGEKIELDFRLRPGVVVRGRVTNELGEPVEGAKVQASSAWYGGVTTRADGRYELDSLDPVQPQEWLSVKCAGYALAGASVTTSGGVAERDFVLSRGVRVEGAVVDGAGNPVRAAEVWIGEGRHFADMQRTLSRDDGSFRFDQVASGARKIGCEKRGLPSVELPLLVPSDRDTHSGVVLRFGESHFLAGIVVDRDGAPIAGAHVMYCSDPSSFDGYTKTDSEGTFRLEAMGAGPYTIRVSCSGYLMGDWPSGSLDRDDARFVLERGGALAGRVVDAETGEPVRSFRIRFVDPTVQAGEQRASGWEATWSDPGRTFVADDGVWHCRGEGIAIGSVVGVEATAQGYAATIARRVIVGADPGPDALVLRMGRGARVTGSVLDEVGQPVEGALVRLEAETAARTPWQTRNDDARWCVRSRESGLFEIEGAPAGEWRLAIEHPGFAPCRDGPFAVPERGAAPARTIRLERGGTIEGVVLDAEGRAQPGRDVLLFVSVGQDPYQQPQEVVTDGEGEFRFERLPRGRHQVSLVRRQGRNAVNELSASVRVDSTEPRTVKLQPAGDASLRGRITGDDHPGAPCVVNLQWLGPPGSSEHVARPEEGLHPDRGTFSQDGEFTFESLAPGRYFVSVSRWTDAPSRYDSGTATVDVAAGSAVEVTVRIAASR